MDIFIEQIIKRKKDGIDYAIIAGIILLGIIITAVCVLIIGGFSIGIAFLLIAAAWYGAYLLIHMRNLEYEYILTNSDLDIDKIVAKRGRKRLISVNLKEISILANVEDSTYANEYRNITNINKTINAVGDNTDGGIYFVDFHLDGVNNRVLFQPNDKIKTALKTINPRLIHITDI